MVSLIGYLIIFFAAGYSVPPMKFESRGFGEATVGLVLNILVPVWGYVNHTAEPLDLRFLAFMLLTAFIQFGRMMIMNIADRKHDEEAKKRTSIVIMGMEKATKLYIFMSSIAYVGPLFLIGHLPNLILILHYMTLPFFLWIS